MIPTMPIHVSCPVCGRKVTIKNEEQDKTQLKMPGKVTCSTLDCRRCNLHYEKHYLGGETLFIHYQTLVLGFITIGLQQVDKS